MKKIILIASVFTLIISCGRINRDANGKIVTKHCFNDLPEGVVVNIGDLRNNGLLHIRKLNSTELSTFVLSDKDYKLRMYTFNEGDTITHCN